MTNDGWCCSNLSDGSGLWFNEDFEHGSEAKWLAMLEELTLRYAGNPRVIGMDLRNEVRPDASRAYATRWTWWGSFFGTSFVAADWRHAAQEGAKIVLNEWRKNILEGAEMNKIKHRVPPLTTDVVTLRSRHARMIPGVPENMIK